MEEQIKTIWFENNHIFIKTNTGETFSQPLEAFPALFYASDVQRNNYYLWDNNRSVRWKELDEDIHISNFHEKEKVNYDNPVNNLLSRFPWIDLKEFAAYLGMHWTKLARYKYGVWTPSAETLGRIKNGIISIGKEMMTTAS